MNLKTYLESRGCAISRQYSAPLFTKKQTLSIRHKLKVKKKKLEIIEYKGKLKEW